MKPSFRPELHLRAACLPLYVTFLSQNSYGIWHLWFLHHRSLVGIQVTFSSRAIFFLDPLQGYQYLKNQKIRNGWPGSDCSFHRRYFNLDHFPRRFSNMYKMSHYLVQSMTFKITCVTQEPSLIDFP